MKRQMTIWKVVSCLALLVALIALAIAWQMHRSHEARLDRAISQAEADLAQRYAPVISALANSLGARTRSEAGLDEAIDNLAEAIREAVRRSQEQPLHLEIHDPQPDLRHDAAFTDRPDGNPADPGVLDNAREETQAVSAVDAFSVPTSIAHSGDRQEFAVSAKRGGQYELLILDAHGNVQRRLTHNSVDDHTPSWSPDGSRIAFTSDLEGSFDLYVINRRGGDATRLTFGEDDEIAPAWSPDGRHIAYTTRNGTHHSIRVLRVDSSDDELLIDDATLPSWSPDGTRLAFVRDLRLHVARADGSEVEPLLRSTDAAGFHYAGHPRWSPDGATILFTGFAAAGSPFENAAGVVGQLILVGVEDRKVRVVGDGAGSRFGFDWSPDGKRVLYLLTRVRDAGLYSTSVEAADVVQLRHSRLEASWAAWRPMRSSAIR